MNDTLIFWLIVSFIVLEFLFDKLLDALNARSWDTKIPDIVADLYSEEEYQKAKNYAQENGKLSLIVGIFNFIIVLMMLFLKGFAYLDQYVRQFTDNSILQTLLFFALLTLANSVINIPFSWYKTFVIEEKYGFNKMTKSLFLLDFIKSLLLGAAIGALLLSIMVWLFEFGGNMFWIYLWLFVAAFSLFFAMFYTTLIVPIFNKLTPLPEGELRESIELYASKVGFSLKNIFVIDGSKRSSKSNAYFSGLGAKKSIVLYDTLIADNSKEELTAILAHEVGHYKKKHILYSMFLSIMQMGVMFYIFGYLSQSHALVNALGVTEKSFHIALLAFTMLYSPVSLVLGILMNSYSRKNEYEADAFAKNTYEGKYLVSALKKLAKKHLTNLTPNPIYTFIHFSHPPLVARLKALL